MSAKKPAPARILHIASDFAASDRTARIVRIAEGIAPKAEHVFVSAKDDASSELDALSRAMKRTVDRDFPSLSGLPLPGRLQKIAKAMKGFDLVLTYGWEAMDAVMAHTLFSEALDLPRLVHHEEEADILHRPRSAVQTWYRRIALGKSSGLVIPSEAVEEIALVDWQQPLGRVKRIPNGVDVASYAAKPQADAIPRLLKRPGECWVGSFARMDGTEKLEELVGAFATLTANWHLVICGDGPAREALEEAVDRLEQNHRVHIVAADIDPAKLAGLFDIYAQAFIGGSERIVQAMAAGCPVIAYAPITGDLVSEQNAAIVDGIDTPDALQDALVNLARDEKLRTSLGKANRAKARSQFDNAKMLATYKRLYASAARREL